MRAQHEIDAVGLVARGFEVVHERGVEHVHHFERIAVAAVADAGVDHQVRPGRIDDQRVHAQAQVAFGGDEMWEQPWHFLDDVGRRSGNHFVELWIGDFVNSGNGDVTDFPFHIGSLLQVSLR